MEVDSLGRTHRQQILKSKLNLKYSYFNQANGSANSPTLKSTLAAPDLDKNVQLKENFSISVLNINWIP